VVQRGFRSTFRDWAAERTNFPREVAEAALAHIDGDETERAYQRGDLFDKRCRLMDAWAKYCAAAPAEQGKAVLSAEEFRDSSSGLPTRPARGRTGLIPL